MFSGCFLQKFLRLWYCDACKRWTLLPLEERIRLVLIIEFAKLQFTHADVLIIYYQRIIVCVRWASVQFWEFYGPSHDAFVSELVFVKLWLLLFSLWTPLKIISWNFFYLLYSRICMLHIIKSIHLIRIEWNVLVIISSMVISSRTALDDILYGQRLFIDSWRYFNASPHELKL